MRYHILVLILGLSVTSCAFSASAKEEPKRFQADLGVMDTPWGVLHVYDRLMASKTVAPQVPSSARKKGLACELIALSLIAPDGHVTETRIQRSSGATSLDDAALVALKQWKYRVPVPGERCVSVQRVIFSIE